MVCFFMQKTAYDVRISVWSADVCSPDLWSAMDHRDLLSGFVRLHILLHAADEPVYGSWIIEELAHHGYKLSPGTLYPMLHAMGRRAISSVARSNEIGRASCRERVCQYV